MRNTTDIKFDMFNDYFFVKVLRYRLPIQLLPPITKKCVSH